ncbi:MAG: T9SS type A sorting domain-containing protein [Bacteroidia bacterium]|nr:T9SS type A sorting domain-containing protein [Bacteroidia bacterium]
MRKFKHLFLFAVAITFSGSIAFGQGTKTPVAKKQNLSHDGKASSISSVIRTSHNSVTSPDFSTSDSKALLYSNGPFRTDIGTGPAGGDVSMLAAPLTNYGFGHNIATFAHVAEDVLINATSWTIDSLVFYSYQTNSTLTSTFTAVHVAIWDGDPSLPTSTIVWGDTTTNVLSRTVFSGCYRANTLTGATRPIMRNVVNVPAIVLNGGAYWIQWASAGSLTSGPWANPITITGQAITGNAKQKIGAGAWGNLLDGTNGVGLPFEVYGTEVAATCPFPTTLAVTNITDISASLGWTEIGTATTWNIEYGVTGFTQGAGTAVNGTTTNPYALAGLTANTTYDFYVQSDCGGSQSLWAGPFTFSTLACPIANQCGYVLEFADSYGDGWNGASVEVIQNGVSMGQFTLAAGTAGNQTVNICDAASIELIWTDGLYPEECGFTLKDPFGVTLITFVATASPTAGSFFTFTSSCTPPACMFPTALSVGTTTTTSASLNWTNGGTETAWNVQYGLPGFAIGTGTIVAVTAHPYTLSGLTVGTSYEYYVQADCGGTTSTWVGPFAFNTACDVVNTFPWVDGFESGIACYTITGLPGVETWALGTASPNGGTNDVEIDYDPVPAPQDQWIKSPVFNFSSLSAPQITFFWNMSYYWGVTPNDNYNMFLKGTTDGTTWTTLWTEPATFTDWTYYDTTISLAAYAAASYFQFAFEYVGTDGAAFYLDDITIDNITSINESEFAKSVSVYPNPTFGAIKVSRVNNATIEVYDIVGNKVAEKANTNTIDISNLTNGTYLIKVITENQVINKKINLIK